MGMKGSFSIIAACIAALALWGCGREADKAARTDSPTGAALSAPSGEAGADRDTARADASAEDGAGAAPTPLFKDGKPMWASSRRRTAEEGAQRQFDRNGADFDAATLDAYVAKAHAFLNSPPKGVLTARRDNGDTLYYDPKGNVFAVADKDGSPRTLFKPRDGMDYWTQQQTRLAQGGGRGTGRSRLARVAAAGSDGGG